MVTPTPAALPEPIHWVPLAVVAGLAALLAVVATPVAISAARATGFLDKPSGTLKRHREPTPYLGGLAVFIPFLTAAALVFKLDASFLAILLTSTLATLLGLMDDFGAMRPGVKLAGQVVIVLVLLQADVRIKVDALPTWLDLVMTGIWMLAIMNAVNFLDIVDGLAASVSTVAAGCFLLIALLTHQGYMASLSAALVGALLGYLRSSLPPARIFLGDAGSLLLGATLGSLALALDYSAVNPWAVAAPVLVLAVPLFELTFTVLARIARRRAPWRGSPDHVALRMLRLGVPLRGVLAVATGCGLLGGAVATGIVIMPGGPPWSIALPLAVAVVAGVLLARAPDAPRP